MNLREGIINTKRELELGVLLHDRFLLSIERLYPELLEIDCFNISASIDYNGCWLEFQGSVEGYPHLMIDILDILGIDYVRGAPDPYGYTRFVIRSEFLKFPRDIPNPRITVNRLKRIRRNCTRYRVIQEREIEVCGELDTTKYLSVEKVEEET